MGARGPKKEQRVSGTGYDIKTQPGAVAIAHLKYKRKDKDTGLYEIDTDTIADAVNLYLESSKQITDEATGAYIQLPISRVGLRLALGISRDTYARWLQGYVDQNDIDNDEVKTNTALSEAIRAGDDRILQYLVETCDKYGDTKRIRLLETYGEIAPSSQRVDVSVSRGKSTIAAKYGK